ncbi:MAG TPA: hypothetical protein VLZ84_10600 [Asticcacaulis sp.]|nr:hypothetical protein [Asticcacaulis sp.]
MQIVETLGLSLLTLILCGGGAILGLIIVAWKGIKPGVLICAATGVIVAVLSLLIVLNWSHTGLIASPAVISTYLTVLANDLIVWMTVSAIGLGMGYGLYILRTQGFKR